MFRTLIILAALALSGCASYGPSYRDERAPVYRDGSYYSPSASGYGDYYYAPEYRYYDPYYDDYSYGWGYPYGYGYGAHHLCSFRYRPCGYGSYWGSGFGLSLFFGNGWSRWNDPWYGWPYYGGWYGWHRDRDWDRDHDWNRDHDRDRPRQPNPPYTGGDRNRNPNYPGAGAGWPNPGNTRPPRTDRPIEIRDPYPVRDRNRNPGYRDERGEVPMPVPRDRNLAPLPRDRNVVVMPREPGAPPPADRNRGGWQAAPPPPRNVGVMPREPSAPPPVDRNRGGWQVEPPAPRNDSDDNDRPPPPARRERSGELREGIRRDGERRPALQ